MFSYYYNNQRHTSVDSDYLDELLKDNPNAEDVKKSIIRSFNRSNKTQQELFMIEMSELNIQYDNDIDIAIKKYNTAVARDGVNEDVKILEARELISSLDSQYDAEKMNIINKYYGA